MDHRGTKNRIKSPGALAEWCPFPCFLPQLSSQKMGRLTASPILCKVCGDKTFGRHYGSWVCDGCSCFFKRSIRRNAVYQCVSGDGECSVDKSKRNWCQACRFEKCVRQARMQRECVQKERGPRRPMKRKRKAKERREKKLIRGREDMVREEGKDAGSAGEKRINQSPQLISSFLIAIASSPALASLPPLLRHRLFAQFWPQLLLLFCPFLRPDFRFGLPNLDRIIEECFGSDQRSAPRPPQSALLEEAHLLCSILLCKLCAQMDQFPVSLVALLPALHLSLLHRCSARDPENAVLCAVRFCNFVNEIAKLEYKNGSTP